jgi:ankyrin repeat protein
MEMQPVDHLLAAVLRHDTGAVEQALADDPNLAVTTNMFGVAPLHAAHFTGQAELVRAIDRADHPSGFLDFELGRADAARQALQDDPELATRFAEGGGTALHAACYWGQLTMAELLLEHGADASAVTRDSFLQIAPLGAAVATTPGVPQPSDDEDVVVALVRLLLEHGAPVDHRRLDGTTALHAAAWRGLDRVCQELLDAGADRSVAGRDGPHAGQTPADTALSQGHVVLASALDSGVADVGNPYG